MFGIQTYELIGAIKWLSTYNRLIQFYKIHVMQWDL